MAQKDTSRKGPGAVAKLYLIIYNLAQIVGWSVIFYKVIQHQIAPSSQTSLWDTVKVSVIIFQNAAFLEIIHAVIGIVKSNPFLTFMQIMSRIIVVVGAFIMTTPEYAVSSSALPLSLYAWSITEVIRYSFYFTNLIGYVPQILVWFRYTTFIILYPIGITGELLCLYAAVQYSNDYPDVWSYTLPNSLNFTFSYKYFLISIMLSYVPFFPILYGHMMSQRRKVLGTPSTKKAQ